MTVIAVFLLVVLGIAIFPMLIPYLLSGYMVLNGFASRSFINNLNISVGGANIFLPDLFFATAIFLTIAGVTRILITGRLRLLSSSTKVILFWVACYILFFMGKIIAGYIEGVPLDSMVRRFALDTQCIYLFVPLLYLKQEKTLRTLLYFIVLLSILFPLGQPFLYGTADQVSFEQGQGTLRLGFGYANLLMMLGVLAFFVWENKIWLSSLPLAGIAMLAQRSAFISLALCIIFLTLKKKNNVKFISMLGASGLLLIATLFIIQTTMNIPVVDKAIERVSETFEYTGTTKARINVIPITFEQIGNKPWLGFSYKEIYTLQLQQNRVAFAFNMLHPHNFILSSLLRTGFIGTLILFIIIALVLLSAYKLMRERNIHKQGMYLFSTLLFFIVFGIMNTSFISAGYVFWILTGITLWYLNQIHYLENLQGGNEQ